MNPPRIALATAIAAFDKDADLAPLQAALQAAGARAEVLAWDDPSVSWSRFDAVVLRSTWDYAERLPAFLAWCDHVHAASALVHAPDVVRWNTDKHYLAELARAGVPVVPSAFLEPGDGSRGAVGAVGAVGAGGAGGAGGAAGASIHPAEALERVIAAHEQCVVKPAVGAGSRDAQRFTADHREAAAAHARRLLADGRSVLVQPYLERVDRDGESALMFLGGQFSHCVRKGPLLAPNAAATGKLFATETLHAREASAAELAVARKALAAQPFGRLPYARVDLLPSAEGPLLLELELTEPSLFFAYGEGSAQRFAAVLLAHLAASAPAATGTI